MRTILLHSLVFVPLVALSERSSAQVIRVDDTATGANNGTSWQDAFTDLQAALAAAGPNHDIWVARGTYKPTATLDRLAAFEIHCSVYGGFDGTETSLADRAGLFDETILSGDLLGNDGPGFTGYADNSHNVVFFPGIETPILDGLTVRGGSQVSGGGWVGGGGLFIHDNCLSATVRNCTFVANQAEGAGGGIWKLTTPTLVERCTFIGNRSQTSGGGMVASGNSTIRSCRFLGNFAEIYGGGVIGGHIVVDCLFSGNHAVREAGGAAFSNNIVNCTFSENTASIGGGVVTVFDVVNCILWGNSDSTGQTQSGQVGPSGTVDSCIVQGWDGSLAGSGTFDADPLFRSALGADGIAGTLDDNLSLQVGSPCIDTADVGAYVGAGIDALGMPREIDSLSCDGGGALDRGALERQQVDGTTVYCDSTASSLGVPAEILGRCTASLGGGAFTIAARPVPDGFAILLLGEPGPPVVFGDGTLCVAGLLHRTAAVAPNGGTAAFQIDPSVPPGSDVLTPGATVGLQVLFRDAAAGGTGFNVSSAMRLLGLP